MARSKEEIDAEEQAETLRYISNPDLWVQLYCPIKKRATNGGFPQCAYMIGDGPNIYHGNMWMPEQTDRKEEFKNYSAIVDAGWVVD